MKKNKSTDLTALLPRARSGDQEAQLAIVTAFRPLVQKLAGQEKNPSLRMDLASQLVLGLLEAIRKYPGTDARRFPGFVRTHLTHLLSHYIRKQARWNRLKEKMYTLEGETTYQEDFTRSLQKEELRKALQQLDPEERTLIQRAACQKVPWKKLQKEFHCPASTLYGRYRRALRKVGKKLKGSGTDGKED
mgnify:CR=1 FL=1